MFSHVFFLLVSALGLLLSVYQLHLELTVASLNDYQVINSQLDGASRATKGGIPTNSDIKTHEIPVLSTALHPKWTGLSRVAPLDDSIQSETAHSFVKLAGFSSSADKKADLLCNALEHLIRASQFSPHKSRHPINIANVQNLLDNEALSCKKKLPKFSPSERLAWSEQLAPFDTRAFFYSAKVARQIGDIYTALRFLRNADELSYFYTNEQRKFAFSLVENKKHLLVALPRRYPQILQWLNHFSGNRRFDYHIWQDEFFDAAREAMADLDIRYAKQEVSATYVHEAVKRMLNYPYVYAHDNFRRSLDLKLSEIMKDSGQLKAANFFLKRSKFRYLQALKTSMTDDNPSNTMLFGWQSPNRQSLARLDQFGRTLGVYIPADSTLYMIILEANSDRASLTEHDLVLYGSSDNKTYEKIRGGVDTSELVYEGRQFISLTFDGKKRRFLKIHFQGKSRQHHFVNSLERLIQVYGEQS